MRKNSFSLSSIETLAIVGILGFMLFVAAKSYRTHLISIEVNNLNSDFLNYNELKKITDFAIYNDDEIVVSCIEDILANFDRDPACTRFINPLLYYKGFQALQCYRIAHFYLSKGEVDLAYFIQMLVSNKFSVDIHPAAFIGKGILMDHAHGIVIGETARVGDNVSLLHSVTLGGTGKEEGDRHPKIGNGVLLGAGAKVLGNINIGHCAKIASGSVVFSVLNHWVQILACPELARKKSGGSARSTFLRIE